MKKGTWQESAVVYQIYPRSFKDSNGDGIGDLKGIEEKLEYLKELGADILWLNPIYDSPNDDNGYDIRDYRKIMTEFGTMEDFKSLLTNAHKNGIRIMLDLVVNHSSDENIWFEKSKENDPEYADWYIWKKGKNGGPPNNWGAAFGGSAWEYVPERDMWYLHLFSKKQPDLNWENANVRKEVYDIIRFWFDMGIDGFRMDVINMISKDPAYEDGETNGWIYGDHSKGSWNGPRIHEYLHEMNREVLSKYDIMTVGEMPGVDPELVKDYTADDREELQMVFQFEHMDLDKGPRGEISHKRVNIRELKECLSKWQYGLADRGWNSLYWNNHDQPRIVSRFGNDGKYRVRSAKTLGTCLHMMKGTPYIYMGEEIGMTNVPFCSFSEFRDLDTLNLYEEMKREKRGTEEELLEFFNRRSRDNARTPMQWDGTENAGFTKGEPWIKVNPNYKDINVEKALEDKNSVFWHYKELIRLRHESETVRQGRYELLEPEREDLFCYTRTLGESRILVVCSFSDSEASFEIPSGFEDGKIMLSTDSRTQAKGKITLLPWESFIIIKE